MAEVRLRCLVAAPEGGEEAGNRGASLLPEGSSVTTASLVGSVMGGGGEEPWTSEFSVWGGSAEGRLDETLWREFRGKRGGPSSSSSTSPAVRSVGLDGAGSEVWRGGDDVALGGG